MLSASFIAPPEPPKPKVPPHENPIPDYEDPSKPQIPEEVPMPPTPDPMPNDNPPITMMAVDAGVTLREIGGRIGPDATRFGDWELNGKCVDF